MLIHVVGQFWLGILCKEYWWTSSTKHWKWSIIQQGDPCHFVKSLSDRFNQHHIMWCFIFDRCRICNCGFLQSMPWMCPIELHYPLSGIVKRRRRCSERYSTSFVQVRHVIRHSGCRFWWCSRKFYQDLKEISLKKAGTRLKSFVLCSFFLKFILFWNIYSNLKHQEDQTLIPSLILMW